MKTFLDIYFIVFAIICPFGMWHLVNDLFNSPIENKWFRKFCVGCSIILMLQVSSFVFIVMDSLLNAVINLFK